MISGLESILGVPKISLASAVADLGEPPPSHFREKKKTQ